MALSSFFLLTGPKRKPSTVHNFSKTVNGGAPMHSVPDEYEQLAVSALHALQFHSQTENTPHHQQLVVSRCPNVYAKTDRVVNSGPPRSSTTKRVVLPLGAFLLTLGTIIGILQFARSYIFPVLLSVLAYTQSVIVGEEEGIQCSVWSNSPMQQLRCTLMSFTNGYVVSLLNDVSRELMSKQWGALPTCIGYVCTAGWAMYLNYIYIFRRGTRAVWYYTFSLYRAYYLALNNPMMPLEYIEQSMMLVDVE